MTTYTKAETLDDPEFLAWVERVIAGVETRFETDQCYVVKIDNWFRQRWLGFSGKSLGALGWVQGKADVAAVRSFTSGIAVSVFVGGRSARATAAPAPVATKQREFPPLCGHPRS